jgi:cysteine-rich repeat protein
LHGRVSDESGAALAGAIVTAIDDERAASVSVFTAVDGTYEFPDLQLASYRVRAKRVGLEPVIREGVMLPRAEGVDFVLASTLDLNAQLPPSYFYSLLEWPNDRVKGDFTRACGNCHQIGDHRFRQPRAFREWESIVNRMIGYGGVPFFDETRELLLPTLAETFSPEAPLPEFETPPAPSGDAVLAVIYEWEIDPALRPSCHDLELGTDGTVYTVGGVWSFNPTTGERASYPVMGGGHSIERDANGDMWITAPGPEQIIKFDVRTKEFTTFDQPRIGDDLGSYQHTLRFDDMGRIWYTLSRSNHVCRFDPPTAQFTYYRLPPADPQISGVPIPVPYGCDVAPDQTVWWSQLFGHRIGRVDPVTGQVSAWRTPFDGPRRLHVGPNNVVWVPGYGSAELGRFDPVTETWTVYSLPTQPEGSELPYALNVNRATGEVWITGSNSDALIRFRPDTEEFTVFQLPTPADFTREIEFDDNNNVWTCTSDVEIGPDTPGTGRIIKLEIRDRIGRCGDEEIQLGEDCDDGNVLSCDGCSGRCTRETGCGDGVRCAEEGCDDGNLNDCDGCSASCVVEAGSVCGDGIANFACGEECDPPGDLCSEQCQLVPVCGNGVEQQGEECDDGNLEDCDGCSVTCRLESGCGDGVLCGQEICDDGNRVSCDGCSASCMSEIGAQCGDGIVNAECGEECDPPDEGCSVICTEGAGELGVRHFTFGGSFFSSALGPEVPLGELTGAIDLLAGVLQADGTAPISLVGPTYYSAAILGGTFGYLCVRIDSCTGFIDCDGETPADTVMVQDSNGAGRNGLPIVITTGQGEAGPPGSVQLHCQQTFVQLAPGAGSDCENASFPETGEVVYTTGHAEAFYLNGNPKVGNGAISASGEPFSCAGWSIEDGPGRLAATYLVEEDPQAGDTANVNVLDD